MRFRCKQFIRIFVTSFILFSVALARSEQKPVIFQDKDAGFRERLAAKEVRRYLYVRTDILAKIVDSPEKIGKVNGVVILNSEELDALKIPEDVVKKAAALTTEGYLLQTVEKNGIRTVYIIGGSDVGVLYGAYRFAEYLGVRFYMEGDTIPDQKIECKLPMLSQVREPAFELRGIQPFHDFPEGPDWWSENDYKTVIGQLPKMGMNFIGFHCYPAGAEPTGECGVWIGDPDDIKPNGNVGFSYRCSWDTTARFHGEWGYKEMKTSDYHCGAASIFDRDDFGSDVQRGLAPYPENLEQANELFNRVGQLFNGSFSLAQSLGVKTCIGTETPLTIPAVVAKRLQEKGIDPESDLARKLLYEGIFQRIMKTHPLDYYWLWTPEGWTWNWNNVKPETVEKTKRDMALAYEAMKAVKAPFKMATCGWVLGPGNDRSEFDRTLPKDVSFSCINREVGKDFVETDFKIIQGRGKWAIPWLEDDPRLIQPQLWVGRMRKDAYDAHTYGCNGLMGIHWRTRQLGPNVSALAKAAWRMDEIAKLNSEALPSEVSELTGGNIALSTDPIANTDDDKIYQSVRWGDFDYNLKIPNGTYDVTLQFCEPVYDKRDTRFFSVTVQDRLIDSKLDIFAKAGKSAAYDVLVEEVKVTNGRLTITPERIADYPAIAGIIIDGKTAAQNQFESQPFVRKINCGGDAYQDYQKDVASSVKNRHLPTEDFYIDWAGTNFGQAAKERIGRIFAAIDGKWPEACNWHGGPGGINRDHRDWSEIAPFYRFVDDLEHCDNLVSGGGNRERYNYWLNTCRYWRQMAKVACTLGALEIIAEKLSKDPNDIEGNKLLIETEGLNLRKLLVEQWNRMQTYLLATVTNTSELGTISNIEQHNNQTLLAISKYDALFEKYLGKPLDNGYQLTKDYSGPDRLIVYPCRTSLNKGEPLELKVALLSKQKITNIVLKCRNMGEENYERLPVEHIVRSVYKGILPAARIHQDFEYYLEATLEDGAVLRYPASSPRINNTVVIME